MASNAGTELSLQATEDAINNDLKITCSDDSLDRIYSYIHHVNTVWWAAHLSVRLIPKQRLVGNALEASWEIPEAEKVINGAQISWSLPINIRTNSQPIVLRFSPEKLRLKVFIFGQWMQLDGLFKCEWIEDANKSKKKLIITKE